MLIRPNPATRKGLSADEQTKSVVLFICGFRTPPTPRLLPKEVNVTEEQANEIAESIGNMIDDRKSGWEYVSTTRFIKALHAAFPPSKEDEAMQILRDIVEEGYDINLTALGSRCEKALR